jgi:hypothetical protein
VSDEEHFELIRGELASRRLHVVTRRRGALWLAFACDHTRPVEDAAESSPITTGRTKLEAAQRLHRLMLAASGRPEAPGDRPAIAGGGTG